MQTELKLPPITERIHSNVSYLTIKCLRSPRLAPHYSRVIRTDLGPPSPIPRIQPGGRTLIKTVCSLLLRLNVTVPEEVFVPGPPPWLAPVPAVRYTPTSKAALPVLQRQLALEAIEAASSSVPVSHRVYTDGSLQSDGRAGSAVFSPDMEPPGGGWVGRRLLACSSSTFCELQGVLDAVTLLCQRGLNGVVTLDGLAKAVCGLPPNGNGPSPSLLCYRARLRSDALLSTARSRDTLRGDSVSIQHYDVIRAHRYKYRRRGLMVRRHNVVSARLRLGYRPVWQVAGMVEEPHFTSCQLCDAPSSNTLAHYCLHCHVVRDMLPRGLPLTEICRFLLVHDNLDTILVRHPRFGGC
ncbi:hypothetical protein GWK47_010036 [Chionoecetes opilio]|uniref:Uncharacterized protein n=1 Tax=Chionoecetes opilio TaxID=41210 RepID=A0A8J4Y2P7_CHIOP|nr:hypothetical protein GWK47_010036 [Chionoecetes opilio]